MRPPAPLAPLLVLLLAALLPAENDEGFLTRKGEPPPAVTLHPVSGTEVALDARDAVTALLFFDCESDLCKRMVPAVQEFLWPEIGKLPPKPPVRFLAVVRGASESEARAVAETFKATFPVVPDPDRALFSRFAKSGVPRFVIIGAGGTIQYQHNGFVAGREAEFLAAITAIAEGREAPTAAEPGGGDAGGNARKMLGKPMPALQVEKWITREANTKGKFVMYEFWATWCGPCRATMPHLEEMSKKYAGKLEIISITDEDFATASEFVKSQKFTWPIAIDTQARISQALAIQGIPHAIIGNPDGTVVWEGHPATLSGPKSPLERLLGVGEEPAKK